MEYGSILGPAPKGTLTDAASMMRDLYRAAPMLEPFDPRKHKPQDVGLGGPSTEYLATEIDPHGLAMNYPTIWWDQQRAPHLLEPGPAYDMALQYEQWTGQKFPRFQGALQQQAIDAAEQAAQQRSFWGGASRSPLAR